MKSPAAALALLMLVACPVSAQHAVRLPFAPVTEPNLFVPDELVVELGREARRTLRVMSGRDEPPRVNDPSFQALLENLGVERFERQFVTARPEPSDSPFPDLTGFYKIKLGPNRAELEEAMSRLAEHPGVSRVEKIGIHALYATPNDPFYQDSPDGAFPYDQWHYWDTHGIDASLGWDLEAGDSSVVVAILDSGVRYFHLDLGGNHPVWGPGNPQFGGNIWINGAEVPGNSLDDDGNGFVDDTIGWDFVSVAGGGGAQCLDQDCGGVDNDPDDGDGHGTHVSGTVAAITNNGRSVSGVAGGFTDGTTAGSGNGARIMCLRIGFHGRLAGQVGGLVRMDWAAEAMAYVADQIDAGVNVTAVNCSWGSSDTGGLGAAVAALVARDVLIVHAAGNSNSSTVDFLGGLDGVMNVAATDSQGAGAFFSNHGSWVDLAAPGVEIVSTYANPDDPDLTHNYIALLDGTSMSAPHTCGAAALLESFLPSLTASEKFDILVATTTPYSDSRDLGSGILNVANALEMAQSQIGVPEELASLPPLLLSVFPNPVRSGMEVIVESRDTKMARVAVFDVGGRLVSEIARETLVPGTNRFRWERLDSRGRQVPGGAYIVTVQVAGAMAAKKLIVVP